MSNLRTLRNFFSCQEQLSLNQLQKIRGGADNNQNQNDNNQNGNNQNQQGAVAALDDNKRPERPGGGVSTH
jgi:hypothetical protein